MKDIVVVVGEDPTFLMNVNDSIMQSVENVTVTCHVPDKSHKIPTDASVFVVDFNMGDISGVDVVHKIREENKEAHIIMWGLSLDHDGSEMISCFGPKGNSLANEIIDKYVENIGVVVRSALRSMSKRSPKLFSTVPS